MGGNLAVAVVVGVCLLEGTVGAQRHVEPSATAARAGSHLPWERDLASAQRRAAESGRRVLWYVPTIPRSPTDRTEILDLYMRAGFFSDPDLAELLRQFVLLRQVPSSTEARSYDLVPFRFIEPGFLILDAAGKELARAHGVTTFAPTWLARRLASWLPAAKEPAAAGWELAARLRHERLLGDPSRARETLAGSAPDAFASAAVAAQAALLLFGNREVERALAILDGSSAGDPYLRFLRGAAHHLLGRHERARALWRQLAQDQPEHPLGWRAAAEAEGFGPIARGFWTYRDLPATWRSDDSGTTAAQGVDALPWLRQRSVEFLLRMQNEAGGWEDSNYDFGGLASLPNVHVAVSAICTLALVHARDVDPEGCDAAIARGLRYVVDPAHGNPEDENEWIWARIYPLHLLAGLMEAGVAVPEWPRERIVECLSRLVGEVASRQRRDGAFRHEYANPFVTGAVLLAIKDAERCGVDLPPDVVKRGVAALARCRTAQGAFSYGQTSEARGARATLPGAAGRMPYCEAALMAFGESDRDRLGAALGAAFEHHRYLAETRKYDDHTSSLAYGGFFFWFDLFGRERAFRLLGEAAAAPWREKQLAIILAIPEIDGCFVDSHELGRSYGTAMALLCLPGRL